MSLATLDLPSDVHDLRALTLALQARLSTAETALATTTVELSSTAAELRTARTSIQLTGLEIAKLKAEIARLRRMPSCARGWLIGGLGGGVEPVPLLRATRDHAQKTGYASEQDRPDVLKRRRAWFRAQVDLDPKRLVFVDPGSSPGQAPVSIGVQMGTGIGAQWGPWF